MSNQLIGAQKPKLNFIELILLLFFFSNEYIIIKCIVDIYNDNLFCFANCTRSIVNHPHFITHVYEHIGLGIYKVTCFMRSSVHMRNGVATEIHT